MIKTIRNLSSTVALPLALLSLGAPSLAQGALGTNPSAATTTTTAHIAQGSTVPNTFPFDIWNGLIVVHALFGDGQPESAVLDTGLPLCLVTPELAAKRSLTGEGLKDFPFLDRSLRISGLKPQLLRVDRVALTNVPFGIYNLFEHLSAQTRTDVPAIWLGTSALEALAITIDPRKQEITIRAAGSPPPPKSTRVPFTMKDGRMWVEIKVNDKKKYDALLDTGTVSTLLPESAAKDLKLTPVSTVDVKDNNGKPGKVGMVRLANLEVGKLKVKDVHAIYVAEGDSKGFDKDLAIIGNDLLMRYKVTIDYGRHEIAFEDLPVIKPNVAGGQKGDTFVSQGNKPAAVNGTYQNPNNVPRLPPGVGTQPINRPPGG
jgi:predicted aspartyl protease